MWQQSEEQSSKFGDRHSRLSLIGDRDGLGEFAEAVRACFCTPEEVQAWNERAVFDDPLLPMLVGLV